MGTSDFGSDLLKNLINDKNYEIAAIYTKEPQIAGRGKKITKSAIHEIAINNNLKVLTPRNFNDQETVNEFTNLAADVAIIVSYGLILPKSIIEGTKNCCINIHPSYLPKWRGAAPMQRTIMNGDIDSAMTIIKMNEKLDAGDIIYQEILKLDENENFLTLSKKMSEIAIKLTKKTLADIAKNKLKSYPQDHNLATYAKKIEKSECKIDWNLSAAEILNKIRALNGNLGAYFLYNDEKIKIFDGKVINQKSNYKPGTIIDKKLIIQCSDLAIQPTIIQRSGKKAINIKDFLLGFDVEIGKKLI